MAGDKCNPVYMNRRSRPFYFRKCKRDCRTNIESLPDELLCKIRVQLQPQDITMGSLIRRHRGWDSRWWSIRLWWQLMKKKTRRLPSFIYLSTPEFHDFINVTLRWISTHIYMRWKCSFYLHTWWAIYVILN